MNLNRLNLLILSVSLALFVAYTWITEFTDSSMIAVVIFCIWGLFSIPNARRWYLRHAKFSVPLAMLISGVEVYQSGYSNEVIGTFLMAVILAYPLIFLPAFRFVVFLLQALRVGLIDFWQEVKNFEKNEKIESIWKQYRLSPEDFFFVFTDDDLKSFVDRGVDLEESVPLWCAHFTAREIKAGIEKDTLDRVYAKSLKHLEKQRLKEYLQKMPGLGDKKVAALVDLFGSKSVMGSATPEDISAIPGISKANAEDILRRFGS